MLDRKTAPKFHRIDKINIPAADYKVLNNQIPVYTISAGKQPVVRIELIFKAGSWFEKTPGVSYFATKMLSEGSLRLNSAQISNEIEKFGAHLDLNSTLDFVVITLECLTKHLPNLLPLLFELLYTPTFPEDEFTILKNIKSQQIRVNKEKTSILASIKFREILFGKNHPYGKDLSVKDIDNLSISDVKEFYDDYFKGDFEIIVSGKPSADTFSLLNEYFGKNPIVQKKGN